MADKYRLKLNGADVLTLGLETCALSLCAGGPNTLNLSYSRVPTGSAPWAYLDAVVITAESTACAVRPEKGGSPVSIS